MAFYYPDGDGGRRELDTGGTTYIDQTQEGAVIARGVLGTANIFSQRISSAGELGDLWTIGFNDAANDIYSGDLLIFNGAQWQLLKTSPNRPNYSLPTASATVKGGVKIGDGLKMTGETLSADSYNLPTASASTKGGVKVGDGLYMNGEYLNVTPVYNPQPDITYNNTILYVDGNSSVSAASLGDGLSLDDGVLSCNISYSTVESLVADVTGSMQESHGIGMTIFDAEPSGVSPPYCYKGDYGGLVLPVAYYEIDFKIRGDEDMFVSKSGELYDESNPNFNNKTNLATDKVQRTNDCFVHISNHIFTQAFSNNKIMIEWGNDSPLGNVVFKGTVASLPSDPKPGWLCYNLADAKFHIYDGMAKKWRAWVPNS